MLTVASIPSLTQGYVLVQPFSINIMRNSETVKYTDNKIRMAVFRAVSPFKPVEVYWRFRGTCCLHHYQGWWWRQQASLKRRHAYTRRHGATTQKTFTLATVRIWILTVCKKSVELKDRVCLSLRCIGSEMPRWNSVFGGLPNMLIGELILFWTAQLLSELCANPKLNVNRMDRKIIFLSSVITVVRLPFLCNGHEFRGSRELICEMCALPLEYISPLLFFILVLSLS
jgi:hypothetical protein